MIWLKCKDWPHLLKFALVVVTGYIKYKVYFMEKHESLCVRTRTYGLLFRPYFTFCNEAGLWAGFVQIVLFMH